MLVAASRHTDEEPWPTMQRERTTEIVLFLMLLICYVYTFPRWADWGQNSRLDLTLAIVDQGTLSIDAYFENTGDYALFEGRHYSDKAPGPSLLAVPVYAAVRPVLRSAPVQALIERMVANPAMAATLREGGTGLLAEKIYQALVLSAITAVVVSLPSAALAVLLLRFLNRLNPSRRWNLALVLIYALATSAFPYAGTFLSHQLVAFLLFATFYLGYRMRCGQLGVGWMPLLGLMLGLAAISEYPSVLIGAALVVYSLWGVRNWRAWLLLALGGAVPLLGLMAYNWAIFGTPLQIGYEYSALYTEQHETGLISLTYPHFEALWGITFGRMRGLFFVSPVLLLAVPGFWAWWRSKVLRAEWAVALWAVVSLFLYNGSSVMWQGGFAVGPRYIVPMLPFLMLGLGGFVARWGQRLWVRVLTVVLAAWSFVVVWALTLAGQSFPDWTLDPLVDYALPRLLAGDIARNMGMLVHLSGWASLLPLVVLLGAGTGLLFALQRRRLA